MKPPQNIIEEGDMVKLKTGQYGTVAIIVGKYAKVRLSVGTYTFLLGDLTLLAKKINKLSEKKIRRRPMTLFDAYGQCGHGDKISISGQEKEWKLTPRDSFIETLNIVASIFGPEAAHRQDWVVVSEKGGAHAQTET